MQVQLKRQMWISEQEYRKIKALGLDQVVLNSEYTKADI